MRAAPRGPSFDQDSSDFSLALRLKLCLTVVFGFDDVALLLGVVFAILQPQVRVTFRCCSRWTTRVMGRRFS